MATASITNTFVAATPAEAAEVNTNFTNLVDFLNNSVIHKDGSKAMTASLDLGSQKIINLATGTSANDAVRYGQLTADTVPLPLGKMGIAYATATQSGIGATDTDLTSLSVTFTAVSTRIYRATLFLPHNGHSVAASSFIKISTGAGTLINEVKQYAGASQGYAVTNTAILTGFSGSTTIKGRAAVDTGTLQLNLSSTQRAFLLIEDMGIA